jgi:hypothetical protein
MKKQKYQNWIKKLLLAATIMLTLSGTMSVAMAALIAADETGACPAGTMAVVNSPGECGTSADGVNACPSDPTKGYSGEENKSQCTAGTDATKAAAAGADSATTDALQALTAGILAFEKMIQKAIWPILFMTGDLMDNDLLFGSGMEERLRAIWVPIRNIVNILFVLALLGLAIYNVLGINGENSQYSIKAMLPKLIAAIIAVNFSFIGIKVFLDAVNVLTVSIFAIPDEVGQTAPILANAQDTDLAKIEKFCRQVYDAKDKAGLEASLDDVAYNMTGKEYNIKGVNKKEVKSSVDSLKGGSSSSKVDGFDDRVTFIKDEILFCTADGRLTQAGVGFFQKYGSNNAALAMAINSGNILFLDQTYTFTELASSPYESFAINAIFSLLMYIVYATAFLALFVVLIVRMVVLWLGLALSPVIALALVIPIAKDKLQMGELITKFVAHAIAPVGIALVMTIGWVMTSALRGTFSRGGNMLLAESQAIPGIPIPGLDTIQGLLISITTVAVVWVGVFAVADSTLAGGLLKGIKETMEKGGKWLATAPIKYTPWVPVEIKDTDGDGKDELKRYTPGSISYGLKRMKDQFETKKQEQFAKDTGILGAVPNRMDKINTEYNDPDDFLERAGKNLMYFNNKNSDAYKRVKGLHEYAPDFYKKLGVRYGANGDKFKDYLKKVNEGTAELNEREMKRWLSMLKTGRAEVKPETGSGKGAGKSTAEENKQPQTAAKTNLIDSNATPQVKALKEEDKTTLAGVVDKIDVKTKDGASIVSEVKTALETEGVTDKASISAVAKNLITTKIVKKEDQDLKLTEVTEALKSLPNEEPTK